MSTAKRLNDTVKMSQARLKDACYGELFVLGAGHLTIAGRFHQENFEKDTVAMLELSSI